MQCRYAPSLLLTQHQDFTSIILIRTHPSYGILESYNKQYKKISGNRKSIKVTRSASPLVVEDTCNVVDRLDYKKQTNILF